MRFEVLSREDMNALSRELGRAGIMNRTREEVSSEASHYVTISGRYPELAELAGGIEPVENYLDSLRAAYEEMLSGWEINEERDVKELFDDSDIEGLTLLTALVDAGAVHESEGRMTLVEKPPLESLNVELRFPIEDVEEYLDELEERFNAGMVTEYTLEKRYFVEVLEVEGELVDAAIELAKNYATEESIVEATFDGIARSVLADTVLKLAEKYRRKTELIEALMEMEPLTVEGDNERVNIYFDEDAIEDFLKTLQTLGYLKVKGNRIWV